MWYYSAALWHTVNVMRAISPFKDFCGSRCASAWMLPLTSTNCCFVHLCPYSCHSTTHFFLYCNENFLPRRWKPTSLLIKDQILWQISYVSSKPLGPPAWSSSAMIFSTRGTLLRRSRPTPKTLMLMILTCVIALISLQFRREKLLTRFSHADYGGILTVGKTFPRRRWHRLLILTNKSWNQQTESLDYSLCIGVHDARPGRVAAGAVKI